MPYSMDNPPKVAMNWTKEEQEKCIAAANAVLARGGEDAERQAIFACIRAAGKSKQMKEAALRLIADLGEPCSYPQGCGWPAVESGLCLEHLFASLAEAKMKVVDGVLYPASDFLVVPDPDKPSTWALQVKRHGKPDHALMGAALAALLSPGGHRGNKYAGPDRAGAIARLKALYRQEGMLWPGEADQVALQAFEEEVLELLRAERVTAQGETDAH